jgi:hypothetical protein
MSKSPIRNRTPNAAESDIYRALKKFKDYKDADRHAIVTATIEKHDISPLSLNNWIKHPEKALTATKASNLVRAAKDLPSLKDEKKHQAYKLVLEELGIRGNHAEELATYGGRYSLRHSYTNPEIIIEDTLMIDTRTPGVVAFWLRYQSRGTYKVFDGLVIRRKELIHLIGLSHRNMFMANFEAARDPSTEVMRGTLSFEELYSPRVSYNRFALHRHELSKSEESFIDKHLALPIC